MSWPVRGSFKLTLWQRLWLLLRGRMDVEFQVVRVESGGISFEGPKVWLYEGRYHKTECYRLIEVRR